MIKYDIDHTGIAVDRMVKDYMREHGCDYARALKSIVHNATQQLAEQKSQAVEKYSRDGGENGLWRVYEDTSTGEIIEVEVEGQVHAAGHGVVVRPRMGLAALNRRGLCPAERFGIADQHDGERAGCQLPQYRRV